MCAEINPRRPIPDTLHGKKVCRGPSVDHCNTFNYDGTDTCAKCQSFYALGATGQCHFMYWTGVAVIFVLGVCGAVFGAVWALDLLCRPSCNDENVQLGMNFRSRQKLHTPKDADGGRKLWPMDTNLCTTMVAGSGLMLHFNFQVFIMLWALFMASVWVVLAFVVDDALFVLGTNKFGIPRDNCILVAWGYETQQRLMWTKLLYLVVVYVGSFVFAILHSVRQLRLFQSVDAKTKTMQDFMCVVSGLPEIAGSDKEVEGRLARCIADYSGQNVVGASICWDWQGDADNFTKVLELDLLVREKDYRSKREKEVVDAGGEVPPRKDPDEEEARVLESYGPLRKWFHKMEKVVVEEEADDEIPDIKEALEKLTTTENAFAVFDTEQARDEAVRKCSEEGGLIFDGQELHLQVKQCEPETVYWVNFGHSTFLSRLNRTIHGFGFIFLALVFWTVVFYGPYAWSVLSFNYDDGAEPSLAFGLTFTMVVVAGNAIMYEVCARVSDYIGFKYKGDRESCYMILYTVACLFNVMLDMVTTYYVAWEIIKGLHFRTYNGRHLPEVEHRVNRFESYAMQRILAENIFAYAFPSTFLIPFLLEPFITIYAPLKVGELIVRAHPKIVGWQAETWLAAAPMEMGRYADILLNVVLGVLILFFPGGYTHKIFFALACSHVVIYAFDHWRVLNAIPQCVFAMMEVDWWSQALFAPCVSLMLSCLVFKANCQGYGYCTDEWWPLITWCLMAFLAHLVVHLLVLRFVVPLLGYSDLEDPNKDMTFRDVAASTACSWFTSNPVHCLRSKVLHEHSPPCMFWFSGKEHLQEVNPDINCFFEDKESEVERLEGLGFKNIKDRFGKMHLPHFRGGEDK